MTHCFLVLARWSKHEYSLVKKDEDTGLSEAQKWIDLFPKKEAYRLVGGSTDALRYAEVLKVEEYAIKIIDALKTLPLTSVNKLLIEEHLVELACMNWTLKDCLCARVFVAMEKTHGEKRKLFAQIAAHLNMVVPGARIKLSRGELIKPERQEPSVHEIHRRPSPAFFITASQ